jgi:signal peptidase II|tara:strand:- start:5584 stop:6078 length:495 start_codon:yes stop_codon:yes gene_type:complete
MRILYILIFLISAVGLDQVSKNLISSSQFLGESINIFPFLDFTLVHNSGVAFSFLSDGGLLMRWMLVILISLVIGYFFFLLISIRKKSYFETIAMLFILSGGLGNLIDRFLYGYVVDFIHLHYANYSFFIFNLADTWITIGAILYIIYFFFIEEGVDENNTSKS